MRRHAIEIGGQYAAKVSGTVVPVEIGAACIGGGWWAKNLTTGRQIRIKTAARLRYRMDAPKKKGALREPAYLDGQTYKNPVVCHDFDEVFDIARERDRPIMAQVGDEVGKAFPSGRWDPCP